MFIVKKTRNTLLILSILALLTSCGESSSKKSPIEVAEDLALSLEIKNIEWEISNLKDFCNNKTKYTPVVTKINALEQSKSNLAPNKSQDEIRDKFKKKLDALISKIKTTEVDLTLSKDEDIQQFQECLQEIQSVTDEFNVEQAKTILNQFKEKQLPRSQTGLLVSKDCKKKDGGTSKIDACGVCGGPGKIKWYKDNDKDGKGNPLSFKTSCKQPENYVRDNTDDNDTPQLLKIISTQEMEFKAKESQRIAEEKKAEEKLAKENAEKKAIEELEKKNAARVATEKAKQNTEQKKLAITAQKEADAKSAEAKEIADKANADKKIADQKSKEAKIKADEKKAEEQLAIKKAEEKQKEENAARIKAENAAKQKAEAEAAAKKAEEQKVKAEKIVTLSKQKEPIDKKIKETNKQIQDLTVSKEQKQEEINKIKKETEIIKQSIEKIKKEREEFKVAVENEIIVLKEDRDKEVKETEVKKSNNKNAKNDYIAENSPINTAIKQINQDNADNRKTIEDEIRITRLVKGSFVSSLNELIETASAMKKSDDPVTRNNLKNAYLKKLNDTTTTNNNAIQKELETYNTDYNKSLLHQSDQIKKDYTNKMTILFNSLSNVKEFNKNINIIKGNLNHTKKKYRNAVGSLEEKLKQTSKKGAQKSGQKQSEKEHNIRKYNQEGGRLTQHIKYTQKKYGQQIRSKKQSIDYNNKKTGQEIRLKNEELTNNEKESKPKIMALYNKQNEIEKQINQLKESNEKSNEQSKQLEKQINELSNND